MREVISLVFMIFFLSSISCGGQEKVSYFVFDGGVSWDFGKAAEEGGELVHIYRFTNRSTSSVSIVNINTYCRCTRAVASKRSFGPGESGEIRVSFNPYGYPGKISKGVRITTEPASDLLLTFTADITPRQKPVEEEYPVLLSSGLRIDRTDFSFGRIPAGTSRSLSLRCVNTSVVPLSLEVSDLRANTVKAAEIMQVWCPGVIPPGEKAEIVMTYSPGQSIENVGFCRDSFAVKVTGYQDKADVSTYAAVIEDFTDADRDSGPAVSISGSYVNLDDVQYGTEARNVTYTLRNIGKSDLVIRDIDCPEGLACSLSSGLRIAPGMQVRFTVTIQFQTFSPGKFFKTVSIMTNDPVRPVKDLMIAARIVD